MIKILIVEDHPIYRQGLKITLESNPINQIIGETDDCDEAVQLAFAKSPDIILLDIALGETSGFKVAREILDKLPEMKIIFLTMYEEEEILNAALNLDCAAYIVKSDASDEIDRAISEVVAGRQYVSKSLQKFVNANGEIKQTFDLLKIELLTKKERKILSLIGDGKTSRTIAELLHISEKTVENHRSNICSKLNISGSNALVKFAITYHLIF